MSTTQEEHLKIRCIADEHPQLLETSQNLVLNHRTPAFLGLAEAPNTEKKCAFIRR